jgi:outer membrane protein TolC
MRLATLRSSLRVVGLVLIGSTWIHAQEGPPEAALEFYAVEPALKAYVNEALERNPSIHAARARHRSALERVPQVTALPDPVVGFGQAIRSAETRVGPQRQTVSLSQAVPWFGKLDLRGQMAVREATATYQLYVARQREVIARVKGAVYNLAYIDTAISISREEQTVLEHYEQLAQTRYATGQGLQQAVIKTQAEITKVVDRLQVLNQQRVTLAAGLNTLMARPPQNGIPLIGRLELPSTPLDLGALYELGNRNRQELQAARELIGRSERSIELAKKDFWPDLQVSAGLVNVGGRNDLTGAAVAPPDDGKNTLNLSIGLTIPIWRDKYHAGVRQAAETLVTDRHNLDNLRDDMEFAIRDQVIRLQTLQEQVNLFDQVLLPQAREALGSTEAAYQTGQVGILDLLDAERVLLDVRLMHERHNADYLVALANLERAVGTKFPVD